MSPSLQRASMAASFTQLLVTSMFTTSSVIHSLLTATLIHLTLLTTCGEAASLLSPDDFIISIDIDGLGSNSNYPNGENLESPWEAGDTFTDTKYLNFGEINTGFIVTPSGGPTTIQSMLLTTANDAEERDPASWKIYGTNDPITSVDNGLGSAENWTLIAEDDVLLPTARETQHTPISFTNSTAYSSYRVLFPTVKDAAAANSMQIAEVGLFTSTDGSGTSVWNAADQPIAFQLGQFTGTYNDGEGPTGLLDGTASTGMSLSNSPDAEGVENVIDGSLTTKYLNFGENNSGFIVTPASGPAQVQSIQFGSANDFPERDPSSFELYGTNETIVSSQHSLGTAENWTLIDSGTFLFPLERDSLSTVTAINNPNTYASYKLLFPTVDNEAEANSMQLSEALFFENTAGTGDNILSAGDFVLAIDADETSGLDTKFLNLGGENGGFIVTPAAGSSTIDGFQISTANDFVERDPASWELYGTNEAISSVDTGPGDGEAWTLIDSGTFTDQEIPFDRLTTGSVVSVTNTTEYRSYRMVFPTIQDNVAEDSVQLSSIEFFGEINTAADPADLNMDGFVDGLDLGILLGNFNQSGIPASGGELTGSDPVDGLDLGILLGSWNPNTAGAAAAIPEPTAACLAFLAAVVAWTSTRRRAA